MNLIKLAHKYIGGLTHAHTVLSNHAGHHESNLTIDRIVRSLDKGNLAGDDTSPLAYVLLNEHPSDPARPRQLGRLSPRGRRLLRKRRRPVVGRVPIMYGLEVSLLASGRTDLTPRLADRCPLIIASRHTLPPETERDEEAIAQLFSDACDNPLVDVLGHPPRFIEDLTAVDWPAIFAKAKATGTAIEVNLNTFPDDDDHLIQRQFWPLWLKELARSEADVFIGTDIHNQLQLDSFISQWHELNQEVSWRDNHLAQFITALAAADIKPAKVITADFDRFKHWTQLDKSERSHLHS